mgnify:CR=1 FL=1
MHTIRYSKAVDKPESALDIEAARAYHRTREAQRLAVREQVRLDWFERARAAVLRLAPEHPQVRRVYLFGSVVQPGRFRSDSDIDVAVDAGTPEAESAFWAALEQALRHDVDLRPLAGPLVEIVTQTGELIYEG